MRTVYEAANLVDAHLVRHALEAEGIPAFIRGEALTGGMGELGVFGLLAVMVPSSTVPRARRLVEALGFGSLDDGSADPAGGDEPGVAG